MTILDVVIERVKRDLAGTSYANRVYGEEWPDEIIEELGKHGTEPAICITSAGAPMRAGLLNVEKRRMDFFAVAPTFREAHLVQDKLRGILEEIRSGEGFRGAYREAGPIRFRDETQRWPVVFTTWCVYVLVDRDST